MKWNATDLCSGWDDITTDDNIEIKRIIQSKETKADELLSNKLIVVRWTSIIGLLKKRKAFVWNTNCYELSNRTENTPFHSENFYKIINQLLCLISEKSKMALMNIYNGVKPFEYIEGGRWATTEACLFKENIFGIRV